MDNDPQIIPQWMLEHEKHDAKRFSDITDSLSLVATKKDIELLATEQSVREIVHWQRNIILAGEILKGGGTFTYYAIITMATLIGAFAIITGAWKGLFVWFLVKLP